MKKILSIALLLASSAATATESVYNQKWCQSMGGAAEVRLKDAYSPYSLRADCVTDKYAVETEYADRWSQSIGQALIYAHRANKRPAVLLLLFGSKPANDRFVCRWLEMRNSVGLDVTLFTLNPHNIKTSMKPVNDCNL